MYDEIEATVSDLVTDFLYYDRKEDEELPVGAIEKAIEDGVISKDQIIQIFSGNLRNKLDKINEPK